MTSFNGCAGEDFICFFKNVRGVTCLKREWEYGEMTEGGGNVCGFVSTDDTKEADHYAALQVSVFAGLTSRVVGLFEEGVAVVW